MSDDGTFEEWLTLAEAARRLGWAERTLRRYASRLPEQAVQRRPGQATKVRLADLANLIPPQEGWPGQATGHMLIQEEVDQPRPEVSQANPEANPPCQADQSEMIAVLERELALAHAQIEAGRVAESELRRLMLADKQELQQLRQKVALLIAPSVEDTVQDAQEGRSAKPGTNAENLAPEPQTSTQRPRRFWEFWRS